MLLSSSLLSILFQFCFEGKLLSKLSKAEIVFNEGKNICRKDEISKRFQKRDMVVANNLSFNHPDKITLQLPEIEIDKNKNLSVDNLRELNKNYGINEIENLKIKMNLQEEEPIKDNNNDNEKINTDKFNKINLDEIELSNIEDQKSNNN